MGKAKGTALATTGATTGATINDLLAGANAGEAKALAGLRAACDADPGHWRRLGDMGWQARMALLRHIAGDNTVVGEALTRRVGALRDELGGPAPPPLERLLIDRVIATWLFLHYAEMVHAQQLATLTMKQGDFHQRRIDRAQRRHISAIKALAEIRRLPLPALQINVAAAGGQQVNVA